MQLIRSLVAGVRALIRSGDDHRDIDRELRAYLDAAVDDKVSAGLPRPEAERLSRLELGNVTALREDVRAAGWERVVESCARDVRFAVRLVRRSPGFSLVVVLTLALGIGGNTAIVSLLDTIYLAPLPIPHVERVVRLLDSNRAADGQVRVSSMRGPHVLAIAADSAVFDGVAAMFGEDLTLTEGGAPERVVAVSRTSGWRSVMAVTPSAGRDFTAEEERLGRDSGVALVSDGLWRRRFGGGPVPPDAVIHLDGRPYTIVGVMPAGFRFPYDADVWRPWTIEPADRGRDYAVFGRLRSGAPRSQLDLEAARWSDRIRHDEPDALDGYSVAMRSLRDNLVDSEDRTTFALLSVVGFLLLLACVNVATLLVARAVSRRKEFVVRAALGASRARQLRQTLTETTLLACAGGVAGVALAAWCSGVTAALIPGNISDQLGIARPVDDVRVLGFALLVTLACGIGVGLVPALAGSRALGTALREGGRSGGADGKGSRRLLSAFVVGQTALALVLVAGAGVMLQGLQRMRSRDLGFPPQGLLTLVVTPSTLSHPRGPGRANLVRQLQERIAALPNVAQAAATTVNPLGGSQWGAPIIIEGRDPDETFNVNHRLVTPQLFQTMGIPVLEGRGFAWSDDAAHPPVVVVSRRLAEKFWPDHQALGKRARVARDGSPWLTIVGVAGDVRDAGDPGDPQETWYLPYAQNAGSRAGDDIHVMVRVASGGPEALTPDVRKAVQGVDSSLAVYDVAAMDRFYTDTLARERVGALLTSACGAFGLLLAALGVYGVMAFTVAARTPEIAMRLALGADPAGILSLVMGRAGRLSAVGLAAGAMISSAVNRGLASLVPEVRPLEPWVLAGAAALLLAVSLVASFVPARRAASVDPLVALRSE